MIFGQETNSWCNECGDKSSFSNNIDKSISIYEKFYLNNGIKSYKGPFWNEFKRIKKEIKKHNNSSVIIWNNINKIGRIGKGNLDAINKIQFENFMVIKDEIKILKPNIIIFLTGTDYDFFIKNNLRDFKQIEVSESLYNLDFVNNYSDINFFKTYHPNALYFMKKNKIVIPKLINEVLKKLN